MIAVVCAACQGSASQQPTQTAPAVVETPPAPLPMPGSFGAVAADEPTDAGAPAPTARELKEPLPAATHGKSIVNVAVSDEGTAALTIDSNNSVRLWPALD